MRMAKEGRTWQRLDAHSQLVQLVNPVVPESVWCVWVNEVMHQLDMHGCKRSSQDSKLHLASSPKQQTGDSLLDVVTSIDVGRHQLKDLLVQLWLQSKFLETSLFFCPACSCDASHRPSLLHNADCGKVMMIASAIGKQGLSECALGMLSQDLR